MDGTGKQGGDRPRKSRPTRRYVRRPGQARKDVKLNEAKQGGTCPWQTNRQKPRTHTNRLMYGCPTDPRGRPKTNSPGFQRNPGDPPSPSPPPCSAASECSAAPPIHVRPPGGAPCQGKGLVRAPCLSLALCSTSLSCACWGDKAGESCREDCRSCHMEINPCLWLTG